jgi:hypothetical protein
MQKVVCLASRFTDSGLRYYIHLLWDKCTNARQKIWQSNLDWQKWTVFFKQAYKANIIGVRSKTAEVLHLIGLKVIERTTFIYDNLKWIEAIKFFYAQSISMYGMISTMFFLFLFLFLFFAFIVLWFSSNTNDTHLFLLSRKKWILKCQILYILH